MLELLNTTVNVSRPSYTEDADLGIIATYTNAYTTVPASIQPATANTQEFYGQRQIVVSDTVYVDQAIAQLTLKRGDVLIDTDNNNYRIQGWRDLAGRGRVLAIDTEFFAP